MSTPPLVSEHEVPSTGTLEYTSPRPGLLEVHLDHSNLNTWLGVYLDKIFPFISTCESKPDSFVALNPSIKSSFALPSKANYIRSLLKPSKLVVVLPTKWQYYFVFWAPNSRFWNAKFQDWLHDFLTFFNKLTFLVVMVVQPLALPWP